MLIITKNYIAKWRLKFNHDIVFTTCGLCYNLQSNKFINQTLKGSTIGYIFENKFHSLKKLRTEIENLPKENLPF